MSQKASLLPCCFSGEKAAENKDVVAGLFAHGCRVAVKKKKKNTTDVQKFSAVTSCMVEEITVCNFLIGYVWIVFLCSAVVLCNHCPLRSHLHHEWSGFYIKICRRPVGKNLADAWVSSTVEHCIRPKSIMVCNS